jgi:DNA-binding NarL/FixJ family response regulator
MNNSLATVPDRLRVAVAASDANMRSRLAALVIECGHELVEMSAAPQVVLSDGHAVQSQPASTVVLGALDGEFAGLLPHDASAAQVDAALRAVAVGLAVRPPRRRDPNFASLSEEPSIVLTPREIEVLNALRNGLSNKAAARHLGISPHTVKFHIESLYRKLGVASRTEAVAKGLKRQIVEL